METMAARFVRYYKDWTDISPVEHEQTGGNFTDFADYARDRAAADGAELVYIQWWNCKPCTENQGMPIPNTVSSFAVIDFGDGTYAMSPNHARDVHGRRQWIHGRPR